MYIGAHVPVTGGLGNAPANGVAVGAEAIQIFTRKCFLTEMHRCHLLGIPYLVFHPGAHMGRGETAGLAALAESLDWLLERTEAFHRIVGLPRLKAVHLNDSKKGLGSRVDRHARAGEGVLGLESFRRIVNDRRFRGIPLIVETPGPLAEWKKEISLLRGLVATRPARKRATRAR